MSEDVEIRERLVRIETLLERLGHDLKNYKQTLEAYMPRREIDGHFAALKAEVDDLKASRKAVIGWLAGAWLSGLTFVASMVLKKL